MEFKDYYRTLGVSKTATDKEIKQAFRKLARKFHPDVNPGDHGAETRFKEINEAYEVLGDADKRRKYDELGANWRQYEHAQAPTGGPDVWSYSGGPGGFRTMSPDEMRDLFGDEDPFSDFFKRFFGGGSTTSARRSRSRRAEHRRGADVEQSLTLTLEQAYTGVTQRFNVRDDGHARTIDVRIPAGVRDGSRVRIAGEGSRGAGGGPAGDLYLRVRVEPHPQLERRDSDLYAKVVVPVTTAVLGGSVDVPTLDSKALKLRVPPMTQNGQRFRLKDQGMPVLGKSDQRGHLYVTIEAQLPRSLTDEQRQLYESLAKLEATDQPVA